MLNNFQCPQLRQTVSIPLFRMKGNFLLNCVSSGFSKVFVLLHDSFLLVHHWFQSKSIQWSVLSNFFFFFTKIMLGVMNLDQDTFYKSLSGWLSLVESIGQKYFSVENCEKLNARRKKFSQKPQHWEYVKPWTVSSMHWNKHE